MNIEYLKGYTKEELLDDYVLLMEFLEISTEATEKNKMVWEFEPTHCLRECWGKNKTGVYSATIPGTNKKLLLYEFEYCYSKELELVYDIYADVLLMEEDGSVTELFNHSDGYGVERPELYSLTNGLLEEIKLRQTIKGRFDISEEEELEVN